MALPILENGSTTNNTAMGIKNGVMELNIKETISKESNRDMDVLLGQMETSTKDSSRITILKATEDTFGWMAENMKAFGKQIKCMEKEPLFGQMVESMQESMLLRKRKAMENSAGQMADATEANGKTESKTAEAHTATSRESRDAEYGLTVRRSSGLTEHL